jgi:hypothetical protein
MVLVRKRTNRVAYPYCWRVVRHVPDINGQDDDIHEPATPSPLILWYYLLHVYEFIYQVILAICHRRAHRASYVIVRLSPVSWLLVLTTSYLSGRRNQLIVRVSRICSSFAQIQFLQENALKDLMVVRTEMSFTLVYNSNSISVESIQLYITISICKEVEHPFTSFRIATQTRDS